MSSFIQVVAGIIVKDNQLLIAKRPPGKHKAGLWEFPGGKIEKQESAEKALFRELKEELGIEIEGCQPFTQVEYHYPEKIVNIQFFWVTQFSGVAKGLESQELQWVRKSELSSYQFPEANILVVNKLMEGHLQEY